MKSIDELKGPRKRKKKRKSTETAVRKPKHSYCYNDGAPILPASGHDDSYTLDSLYDTFNL